MHIFLYTSIYIHTHAHIDSMMDTPKQTKTPSLYCLPEKLNVGDDTGDVLLLQPSPSRGPKPQSQVPRRFGTLARLPNQSFKAGCNILDRAQQSA